MMIKIETTFGDIVINLDEENTPKTAANFKQYVESGFYDGVIFHRVINGFMIQGGGFDTNMQQKPNQSSIQNEANNALPNKRGTIAMARTSDPHSASTQFFINVADNEFLDYKAKTPQGWGYCVFGQIVEGMDVADKISQVATGNRAGYSDVPVNEIVINKIILI